MSGTVDALGRYVNWLSDCYRAGPRYLAVLRIAFALFVLSVPAGFTWAGRLPDEFFRPRPGPFSLLTGIPPLEVLQGLHLAQLALAALLLVGYRTVGVSVLLTLTMVLGSGVAHGFGKVDHQILVELLPLAMAAAGWGSAWSVDRRLGRVPGSTSGFPVLVWGMVVGFAMLTAALPKVANGWLDPTRQATRGYLAEYAVNGHGGPLSAQFMAVDSAMFWAFMDYATIAVEGGLVVALLYPPLFRLVLAALVGFHVGVYLSLGISFVGHTFVYFPFFAAPLAYLVGAARVRGQNRQVRTAVRSG